MATRRDCREWVVQLLFQLDLNPCDDLTAAFSRFWSDKNAPAGARQFTERHVRGVVEKRGEIDGAIRRLAEHWDLERMGVLDRNVLRMAAFEMLYCEDIPPVVSINEAVDIAKYFSSTESGRFVNGMLDALRKGLARPARRPAGQGGG
ncbi:transcription antitermination factor NusB [Verrucomicrobiota bacterium]